MTSPHSRPSRRSFLRLVAGGATLAASSTAFAELLAITPSQTEGPFYPNHLPLDTDNDLLRINDSISQAVGTITHLSGRVLRPSGEPIRNALVEIWQADQNGIYIHTASRDSGEPDPHFQGFGRFLTNAKGEYYFRTIKPVRYAGRTPHIHYAIELGNERVLTTQCYIKDEPLNDRDGVLQRMRNPDQRRLLMADFVPLPGSAIGELTAQFDIVLGHTPGDPKLES